MVLDDDPTIHEFWRRQFKDSILAVYTSPDQIGREYFENNTIGFLVDFDIRGAKMNGLDFIEKYKLVGRAFLVTQEFDYIQVQQRAQTLGCQVVPKPLLEDVIISQEQPQTRDRYDAIVLDDDDLILMTWKMAASDRNKSVLCFSNGSDLKSNLKNIDPDCAFYIDSNLSKNEKGEDIAKGLFELGYKNLYLATGYEPDQFSHVTWVKAIVGKDAVL